MFNSRFSNVFARMKQEFNSGNEINISPEEFKIKLKQDGGTIIDVRTRGEYNEGHLKGALQSDVMNGEFRKQINSLDKNKTYYLYCRSGNRSLQAARMMIQNGFENVYNAGGMGRLAYAGFETER